VVMNIWIPSLPMPPHYWSFLQDCICLNRWSFVNYFCHFAAINNYGDFIYLLSKKFLVFYLSQVTAQAQPILFYRFIIHVDYSSEFSTENQKLLDVSMSNLSSSADWTSKQTSLSENVWKIFSPPNSNFF
jgi:hypothetical protein